jgi:hypothetical protein
MIQRIQSVWLLLAAIAAILMFRLSYYSGTSIKYPVNHELNATENLLLMVLAATVSGLALIIIFLYKKRRLQLRLCVLGILLEALLIFLFTREVQEFATGTYSLTALLHGAVVLFYFLAARGISKDEKLIKESDRLR